MRDGKATKMPTLGRIVRQGLAAAAVTLSGWTAIHVGQASAQLGEMADCEQDDSSPRAVRACSSVLNGAASNLDPATRARVYQLRGRAWIMEEEFHAAIEDYSSALELEPNSIVALAGRAKANTLQGLHKASAADWGSLIALNPKNDEYLRNRGSSLLAAGLHSEALAQFDASLQLNPQGVEAYIGRASVYDAMHQRDQALKEFDRGIAIKPDYLPLYWERAQMAERWGEKPLAIKSYEMVLKINGVYAHARKALVRLGVETPP